MRAIFRLRLFRGFLVSFYISSPTHPQKDNEEKAAEIQRLKQELEKAREAATATAEPTVVVVRNKLSPKSSPPMFRPHSCHVDIADLSTSATAGLEECLLSSSSSQQPADTGT